MALPRFQPRRFQPRVLLGPGTRATEGFLLAEIDRLLAEAEQNPSLLGRPVRIVVPSRSLRLHLASAVMRHRGRATAGLLIQTHFHLALEVIERGGEPHKTGRWLSELVPERRARHQPALARPLEALADGFAAVLPTVRDLLDARFESAHLEALDEALEQDGPQVATLRQVARARALLEVAAETFDEIESCGLSTPARLLTRAADLLEARGEALLPARAVLLHGYADATGVVTDLVQALQRRFGAWVLLDRPVDPATPDGGYRSGTESGPEGRFGEAFVERLTQTASPERTPKPRDGFPMAPEIELFAAQGTAGEVREVARRLTAELENGTRPESLAVVARDLSPYRREIRRRFGLLGLPFSALGEGGAPTPEERRTRAVLDLLRRAGRAPTERWIEALERLPASDGRSHSGTTLMDLRLGLAALGAGRLEDVQGLDLDTALGRRDFLPLPVRQGIRRETPETDGGPDGDAEDGGEDDRDDENGEDDENGDRESAEGAAPSRTRVLRRTLDRQVLEAAITAVRRLLSVLDHWPDDATPGEHRERLETLLHRELGWRQAPAPRRGEESPPRLLHEALRQLDEEAPSGFELDFGELHRLLGRILDASPGSRLGGRGGGVQVLTVTEARGRTFGHLYLLGCNRGVFPRPIREDPLLPDELRRVLRVRTQVLPDLPIKDIGFDEERYLFAQLLSASPRVTLAWQHLDDTGALRPPSPLVERLGLELPAEIVGRDGASTHAVPPDEPLPAAEAAIRVALEGTRRRFREIFPVATAAVLGDRALSPIPPERLAAARLAVLDEQDPDLSTPEGRAAAHRLGPFFGFVGPLEDGLGEGSEGDPRQRELWVTTMERLAGCPWQVFLTKLLGLEPTPDPLTALPGIDPLLLGRVVHQALEDLVTLPGGRTLASDRREPLTLAALRGRSPVRTPWPDDGSLEDLLAAAAHTVLLEEGLALPGLTRALARAARPYLDAAREADWSPTAPAVLGVETLGNVSILHRSGVEAIGRRLRFRADRVDLDPGTGALILTDYKTGRPPRNNGNEGKKEETRRGYLLRDVRAGTRLQAVAYALAGTAWGEGMPAMGRYLFLRPDTEFRDRTVGPWDGDFEEGFAPAFRDAVEAGLEVWDAGSFFPRVVDPQGDLEPKRCSWCPVAEACVRGDSGARLRLADRAQRRGLAGSDPAETAQLALWWLGQEPPSSSRPSSEPPSEPSSGDSSEESS